MILALIACTGHPEPQAKDSSQPNDTAPDTAETGLDSSDSADTGSPPDTGDSADTTETGDTADTGGWDDVTWLSSADGRITGCAGDQLGWEFDVSAAAGFVGGLDRTFLFELPALGALGCGDEVTLSSSSSRYVQSTVWADTQGDGIVDLLVERAGELAVFDGTNLASANLDDPDIVLTSSDNPARAPGGRGSSDDLVVADRDGVYLLRGPIVASGGAADLASLVVARAAEYGDEDMLGLTNALADLDADGVPDIVAAAYGNDRVDRVVLVSGALTGTVSELDADATLWASPPEALGMGTSIAHGDSDGDGTEDLLLSAPDAPLDDHTHSGAVYVLAGPVTGEHTLPEGGPSIVRGDGGILGGALDAADADGDGRTDILVGEPAAFGPDGYPVGGADLVLGPFVGTVDLAIDAPFRHFLSDSPRASAGYTVALTDLDGDNLADVVVGAPDDDVATIDGGAIYLFYSSGWD